MNVGQIVAFINQFGMDAFKALPVAPGAPRHRSAGWRQKRRRKRARQTGRQG